VSTIVVHLASGSPSAVVTGLIAGAVVVVGVVATAAFTRWRDVRRRLEDATWSLLARATRLVPGPAATLSEREIRDYFDSFLADTSCVRTYARWPIRKATAIRAEINDIQIRFTVAVGKWDLHGEPMPDLRELIGGTLFPLVFPHTSDADYGKRLNAALVASGLPTTQEAITEALEAQRQTTPPDPGQS
jgi:hypothetical protein